MTGTEYLKNLIEESKDVKYKNILELSVKSGVGQGSLSAFLSGKKKSFDLNTAWKLFECLGVELPANDKPVFHEYTISKKALKEALDQIKQLEIELYEARGEVKALEKQLDIERKARGDAQTSQPASQEDAPKKMAG